LAETKLAPAGWPGGLAPLRVLLISDIHGGIFLKPETLSQIIHALMQEKPDLVVVAGDLVTGHTSEANPYLSALGVLTVAQLGAWFCFGNHDYYGGDPQELRENLAAIGMKTLKNESISLNHHGEHFVLSGIDDRVLREPRVEGVLSG